MNEPYSRKNFKILNRLKSDEFSSRDSDFEDHDCSQSSPNHCSEDDERLNSMSDDQEYSSDVVIPKLIMQTWKDKDIPKKWRRSQESIKKYMGSWKYVLMTDEDNRNFVKKHFSDFLPYYDKFEYNIQRVDAVRYMWLYMYGGIYMDLDFEILKPMDDFFTERNNSEVYLVSSGNIGVYITNSFMASKPRSKLWLDVIEKMKTALPWYYLGKHARVMNTTGPIMLTHVVTNSNHPYVRLPKNKINPCSVCDIHRPVKDVYLKPLEGSSWASYDTNVYNYFMCNWKPLSFILTLLIIFIIVWIIIKFCCVRFCGF
jgi:mannosyltransferase OCH1-like enzyme